VVPAGLAYRLMIGLAGGGPDLDFARRVSLRLRFGGVARQRC